MKNKTFGLVTAASFDKSCFAFKLSNNFVEWWTFDKSCFAFKSSNKLFQCWKELKPDGILTISNRFLPLYLDLSSSQVWFASITFSLKLSSTTFQKNFHFQISLRFSFVTFVWKICFSNKYLLKNALELSFVEFYISSKNRKRNTPSTPSLLSALNIFNCHRV